MRRAAMVIALLAAVVVHAAKKPAFDARLPLLGTTFHVLPEGKGKVAVESACYRCHSADILVQQRLTEKQWTAALEKMVRWGAVVKEQDKPVIIAYLSKHFGPDNSKFKPIRTRPVGY